MKKRKSLKILIIFAVIIVILAAAAFLIINQLEKNLDNLNNIQISNTDLSGIPDGTYRGSYKSFPVEAEVEVTVLNGKFDCIRILNNTNGQGQLAETIIGRVVRAQSLDVDAVSGATLSSRVILLAIDDALKNAG